MRPCSLLPATLLCLLIATPIAAAETPEIQLPGAEALRQAIVDLDESFGQDYPNADVYLRRLDNLIQPGKPTKQRIEQLESLRREALLANPLLRQQPILFVARPQYRSDHHNTATMFQTGEINTGSFVGGGALKQFDVTTGRTTTLLELPDGMVRDPDVHFDGTSVLFSMRRNIKDDYHLYEIDADGKNLRQITHGLGLSDIDPIYLPDDKILCTSTREPKFCMCNRHIMGNLFVMERDGANIQQIGHSTLHEGHAALLPDGRVLYDRWEYIDRNFGDAQGSWTVNPDGTNHAVYWGNNTNSPGAVLDARAVPGTQRFIATFSSCHDRPWGALALVDRRIGIDGKPPVVQTWPPTARELVGVGNYDTYKRIPVKYEDPWPLSEKHFLCARMTGQGERTGIYLVDTFGNEVLVHDGEPACFDPMPLGARTRPPVVPSRIDLAKQTGSYYVADVYDGTGMNAVERGSVKSIRVVESPEKRFWTQPGWNGSGTQAPGMAWDDFNNKRIIGTAPVAADGSAYVTVPADTWVYFQLLDAEGMMVQSMRSGTIVRPGERAGCAGCHDARSHTIPVPRMVDAMKRSPTPLESWHGPTRMFNYLGEVQPVFDRHCVECHDYGKPAGEKLNLAGDLLMNFNVSYVELRSKKYVRVVGAGPYRVQSPKSWGSHASRLVHVLRDGHEDAKLDEKINLSAEDFDRIVTWIDINAPYYPEYASAYRGNRYGRSPLTPSQANRLTALTGIKIDDQKQVAMVNFTRPELSPVLAAITPSASSDHKEALSIIRAGSAQFARVPRADMPGFKLTDPIEIAQEATYQKRLATENAMRRAIVEGRRQYAP